MIDDGFNDLLENAIFLFVGAFAGSLADAERRQRLRAQEAANQLAAANAELQTQAALAERMRASIASILESIDSGVLTFDLSGQISTTNRASKTLLGCPDGIGDHIMCRCRSATICRRAHVATSKSRLRGVCSAFMVHR